MMQFRNAAAVCAAVGCAAYISSLDCGLCFDDETAIMKNKDLLPSSPWSNLLTNDFWGKDMASEYSHKSYRPLTVATFRLNYMLHELEPLGYHLVNVLLHSAVVYLYVLLCGAVFSQVWPALIAGLLFAVHPIHTEAVTGLVGRAELLSAIFFIGSFLAYHRAAKTKGGRGEGKWVCLCLFLSLCSVLSKEQGITVIGVCLISDYFIYQKMSISSTAGLLSSLFHPKFTLPKPVRDMSRRAFSLVGFLLLFMVLRLQIMKNAPRFPSSANPAAAYLDPPYRQLHWTYLTSFSSWLLFNPSRLSPEYAGTTIPLITSLTDTRNLATLVTLVGYSALGVCVLVREGHNSVKKVGVLALSLLILPYLPASNLFFPVGFVVAERVLYLPSMGFCMLVGFGAWKMLSHHQKLISNSTKILFLFLLALYTAKTQLQNRVWISERDLYISAVRSYPTNSKMWHNLGTQLDSGITLEQSVWLMGKCIENDPHYIAAYSDLGVVLTRLNEKEEAEKALTRAVELIEKQLSSPTPHISQRDILAYVRLSNLIKSNHTRLPEALRLCKIAIERLPDDFRVLRETGHVLLHMGKHNEAKVYLQKALEFNPTEPNVNYLLGVTEGEQGNLVAAERRIRRAISLSPGSNAQVYAAELSNVLRQMGKREWPEAPLAAAAKHSSHTN